MSYIRRQEKYGIGKEVTAGTAVAPQHWINQLSFEFYNRNEYANNTSAYGVIERLNDSTIVRQWAEGELEAKLTPENAGFILLGAFGEVSTAANSDASGSVYDHTFTINQDITGQTFTLVKQTPIDTKAYPLARIGEWALSMEQGDYVRFTASLMARQGATTTATAAMEVDPVEFTPKHMSVKTATSVAGLAGATAESTLESFTLTVNPNIEADPQAGSLSPAGFSSRGYEITFEMTCRYNDTTYEDAYNNGTSLALQVSAVNTDEIIGTAARPGLVVTAPKMKITDWAPDGDLDSPVNQTMTGTIHWSAAEAEAIHAVLTNETSSY